MKQNCKILRLCRYSAEERAIALKAVHDLTRVESSMCNNGRARVATPRTHANRQLSERDGAKFRMKPDFRCECAVSFYRLDNITIQVNCYGYAYTSYIF